MTVALDLVRCQSVNGFAGVCDRSYILGVEALSLRFAAMMSICIQQCVTVLNHPAALNGFDN